MPRHVSQSWSDYLGPGAVSSFFLAVATLLLGLGVPLLVQLRRVLRQAARDEARPSDAILVLGRALRHDRPTEVFAARLAHGARCLAAGLAPRIVVAGGLTGHATRSEADAGREHLLGLGVPDAAILREAHSRHTLENLFFVRETMRAHGWGSVLVVSDPLHLARAAAYARGFGIAVACSPAPGCPPRPGSLAWWVRALREAFFVHWYHVGVAYSRLIRSRRLLSRVK